MFAIRIIWPGWRVASFRAEHVRSPLELLADYLAAGGGPKGRSRANWMLRDAQRFLAGARESRDIEETLFEVKTFVAETEVDDARPIYFHQDETMPQLISILGSKIDNVFDILIYVDRAVGQDETMHRCRRDEGGARMRQTKEIFPSLVLPVRNAAAFFGAYLDTTVRYPVAEFRFL